MAPRSSGSTSSKQSSKKYEDGKIEFTGEPFHSFINKILAADKEHIIYLVPKDKTHSNDERKSNRKALSQKLEIRHGEYSRNASSKTYKINSKIGLT